MKIRTIKFKKGGNDFFNDTIVFILLNVAFFAIMLIVVSRAGSDVASYEQIYAKKVALLIDSSAPGTSFSINIDDIRGIMKKYGRGPEQVFSLDNNKVSVQLSGARGYSFPYFSDYNVKVSTHVEEQSWYVDFNIN